MIRVLFICHGNICRSPMAEFVFKDLNQAMDLTFTFLPLPPAQRKLATRFTTEQETSWLSFIFPQQANMLFK